MSALILTGVMATLFGSWMIIGFGVLTLCRWWQPTLISEEDIDPILCVFWPVVLLSLALFVAAQGLARLRLDLQVWRARRRHRRSLPRCRVVRWW